MSRYSPYNPILGRCRGSVVNAVTVRVSNVASEQSLSALQNVQTRSVAHPPCQQWMPKLRSPAVKRSEREAHHSVPPCACCLHGVHMDIFTFTFTLFPNTLRKCFSLEKKKSFDPCKKYQKVWRTAVVGASVCSAGVEIRCCSSLLLVVLMFRNCDLIVNTWRYYDFVYPQPLSSREQIIFG
jgi:hypothetical protein